MSGVGASMLNMHDWGKSRKPFLNSPEAEIADLTKPDVRTVADATQSGFGHHIHLAMQPTRPSLADAMRILDGLKIRPVRNSTRGRRIGGIIASRGTRHPLHYCADRNFLL